MDIQAEKLEIIGMILETDNSEILKSIKKLLNLESKADFWETLPPDQQDEFLAESEEFGNSETGDFDEFIKKYGQ